MNAREAPFWGLPFFAFCVALCYAACLLAYVDATTNGEKSDAVSPSVNADGVSVEPQTLAEKRFRQRQQKARNRRNSAAHEVAKWDQRLTAAETYAAQAARCSRDDEKKVLYGLAVAALKGVRIRGFNTSA
jgi:hypothetical protein